MEAVQDKVLVVVKPMSMPELTQVAAEVVVVDSLVLDNLVKADPE